MSTFNPNDPIYLPSFYFPSSVNPAPSLVANVMPMPAQITRPTALVNRYTMPAAKGGGKTP